MEKGICAECGLPLESPDSYGYHVECSIKVHNREKEEIKSKLPYGVFDFDGIELERFKTKKEAEICLFNLHHSYIESVKEEIKKL